MEYNRSSIAKKNIFVSLICQLITLLCGFAVPRAMIKAFGSEVYGATSSITQFLAYIALLEGGIGSVAKAVLYKPLAENDLDKISAIMAEIRRFFKYIGLIFAAYVVVIAGSFKFISDLQSLDWITSFVLVIVISISTFGQYFIGISNSILLQAAQKSYIYHIVDVFAVVINAAVTVFLAHYGYSIIIVKLASSIIFFLKPVALWAYVKSYFHLPNISKINRKYLTQKWDCLGQHIAYYLHSNTDIIVLTLFSDLTNVAIYSVYNMVISHIKTITISFVSGMEALFGDMLAKNENELLHKTFGLYDMMMSTMSVILFSITSVMIVPFVMVYTSGINDTDYYAPFFAQLLIIAAMLYCLRMPYHSMVMAAGHFKQTRIAAYGETIINVALSLLLVSRYGLIGVAIGTIVATAFRLIYYAVYLAKNIFFRKIGLFIKRSLINVMTYGIVCLLGNFIISNKDISNYLTWLVYTTLVGGLACAIAIGINMIFYRDDCLQALGKLLPKIKHISRKSN